MRSTRYRPLFSLRLMCQGRGQGGVQANFEPARETAHWLQRTEAVLRAESDGLWVGLPEGPETDHALAETLALHWRVSVPGAHASGAYLGESAPQPRSVVLHNLAPVAEPDRSLDAEHVLLRLHAGRAVDESDAYPASSPWRQGPEPEAPRIAPLRVMLDLRALRAHRDAEGAARPPRYFIRLGPRPLHWKYYFLDVSRLAGAQVVDPRGERTFTPLESESLADGRPALVCRSTQALDWSDETDTAPVELRLQRSDAGRVRVLMPRLPLARPDCLGYDQFGGERRLVSEIYV